MAVTLGELAGFSVPSAVGGLAWAADAGPATLYIALVCAGAGEGTILAGAQWIALRDALPALSARRWIASTVGAAGLAWSLGMLPSTLGDRLGRVPVFVLAPTLALGGTVLLLSIGSAQALVLRAHVARRWW